MSLSTCIVDNTVVDFENVLFSYEELRIKGGCKEKPYDSYAGPMAARRVMSATMTLFSSFHSI